MLRPCALAVAALLLVGCSDIETFEPPVAGEMKPGPGVLSGPSGEFVLLRRSAETPAAEARSAAPAPRKLTDPPPP